MYNIGLNLCEKIKILRAEGCIGSELAGCLKEFRYPGGDRFPDAAAVADLLRRTAAAASAKGSRITP